jgi:hypothetical protein
VRLVILEINPVEWGYTKSSEMFRKKTDKKYNGFTDKIKKMFKDLFHSTKTLTSPMNHLTSLLSVPRLS